MQIGSDVNRLALADIVHGDGWLAGILAGTVGGQHFRAGGLQNVRPDAALSLWSSQHRAELHVRILSVNRRVVFESHPHHIREISGQWLAHYLAGFRLHAQPEACHEKAATFHVLTNPVGLRLREHVYHRCKHDPVARKIRPGADNVDSSVTWGSSAVPRGCLFRIAQTEMSGLNLHRPTAVVVEI